MRFMVLIKATKASEAGALPDEKLLTEMGKYNEELANAGVMLDGEGLHPSSKGARVMFDGEKRTVIEGPFADAQGLIAGFWLWREVEIRQVFEADDFGSEFTPELREREERLRAKLAKP